MASGTGSWNGSCTTAKPIRILSVHRDSRGEQQRVVVDAFAGEIMLHQPDVAEPELFGEAHLLDLLSMRAASSCGDGDRDRVSHPKRIDPSEKHRRKVNVPRAADRG